MTQFIPLAEPDLTGNELEYVTECIRTGWLTGQGRFIAQFEGQFADYVNMKYALAVANGTVAIHLALMAIGIQPGDEVIAPTLSYVASASPILHAYATPVLVDSDAQTWNIDPEAVRRAITPRTKAIIAVHLYGNPCDMAALQQIACEHNLYLIEDAAESHGATIDGQPVGSFGDIACFSFYGNKIVTTGEGGICLTNDDELYERMSLMRGQGMDPNRRYWHPVVGYNYRITNLQAAVGVAQLERMDHFQATRQTIAAQYDALFAGSSVMHQHVLAGFHPVNWLYTVMLDGFNRQQRDHVIEQMKAANIETRPIFHPIHTFPPYVASAHLAESYPVAESLSAMGISLPTFTTLTSSQIERVAQTLLQIVDEVAVNC